MSENILEIVCNGTPDRPHKNVFMCNVSQDPENPETVRIQPMNQYPTYNRETKTVEQKRTGGVEYVTEWRRHEIKCSHGDGLNKCRMDLQLKDESPKRLAFDKWILGRLHEPSTRPTNKVVVTLHEVASTI
jgi:hypothetical protein